MSSINESALGIKGQELVAAIQSVPPGVSRREGAVDCRAPRACASGP
jgi:hypothetical protein